MLNFDIYSISYISSLYSVISNNLKHFHIGQLQNRTHKKIMEILTHSEAVNLSVQDTGSRLPEKFICISQFPPAFLFQKPSDMGKWVNQGLLCFGHVMSDQPVT